VKSGEFKMVRSHNLQAKDDVDVFGLMISKLSRNKQGLIQFEQACDKTARTAVCDFNSVDAIPHNVIGPGEIDIVITSPPYGDSRTTVAYGQYSRLANEWLGYQQANQVDTALMGGKRRADRVTFQSDVLNDTISSVRSRDPQRARDVISFFDDYRKSIRNVSGTLRPGAYACYVVGNRTVKGLIIPTDAITAALFAANGFDHVETIIRNIPNKRMPLKNSPSNVAGETASTMRHEFIVICQKQRNAA